jgi:hypothetical protein
VRPLQNYRPLDFSAAVMVMSVAQIKPEPTLRIDTSPVPFGPPHDGAAWSSSIRGTAPLLILALLWQIFSGGRVFWVPKGGFA